MFSWPLLPLVAFLLSGASVASAHITMTSPAPRTDAQKTGPCGAAGSVRGDTVAVFAPGETIVVSWNETIDHTSHYRIAFDADGQDDFVEPAGRDDLYNSPAVLLDGIGDRTGGGFTQEVTLPDVECERCTLQLIQVMYGSGNYFQCADIALRREGGGGVDAGPAPGGPDAGTPGADVDGGGLETGDDGGGPSGLRDAGPPAADRDGSSAAPPTGAAPSASGRIVGGCSAALDAPRRPAVIAILALLLALGARGARGRGRR